MPEYDAFGREIGEDTLANWRASPEPPAPPARDAAPSEPAPSPVVSPPPRAAPPQLEHLDIPSEPHETGSAREASAPRAARRRRPRVVSRLIILLVLVVVGGNVLVAAVTKVQDAVDDTPDIRAAPGVTSPKRAPVGLQRGSLIRPAAFAEALAELARRDLGRVQTLRLAPERINATLLTPRTTLTSVQIDHGGEFQEFGESGGGFGNLETIPYTRLDPRAPQRLVRAAAARLHRPATRIDYLVPSISSGRLIWGAYFKGGAIFFGDARGHVTRRIS